MAINEQTRMNTYRAGLREAKKSIEEAMLSLNATAWTAFGRTKGQKVNEAYEAYLKIAEHLEEAAAETEKEIDRLTSEWRKSLKEIDKKGITPFKVQD